MATTPSPTSQPVEENQYDSLSDKLVATGVDELITGRTLRFPIYGDKGELLLAEGMTITPEFARRLKQRAIASVKVHGDDLAQVTLGTDQDSAAHGMALDEAIASQIDSIIDDGLLFVNNSEAAVLSQMTWHGTTTYNRQKYLDRINRNKETSVFVDNLMRNALQGRQVDCGEVSRLTAAFLNDITGDVDGTLASALDTIRHNPIADHSLKATLLAMAMGVELGFDAPNVRMLGLTGLVHDWGMAHVPREILEARHWLTEDEYYEIKKHPIYTMRLLEKMCGVPTVVPLIAYQVHERPNGSGYPHGCTGERTHLMAKILGVADAYCAMVTPRPFRPPLIPHSAIECLLRHAATGNYDAHAVRALLKVQSLFAIGSHVALSDGSVARVLRSNGDKYAHPIVRVIRDSQMNPVPDDSEAAIVDLAADGLEVVQALPAPGSGAVRLTSEIFCMGARLNCPQ